MGGSFFPGLLRSQSSSIDKILATVGHLVDSSAVVSAIHFSWRKPLYSLFLRTDGSSLLATFFNSACAVVSMSG